MHKLRDKVPLGKVNKQKGSKNLYDIYRTVCSKMKKTYIVWTPAELAAKYALPRDQAMIVYESIDNFRKTGIHLIQKPLDYNENEVTKSVKSKKVTQTPRIKMNEPNKVINNDNILLSKLLNIREKYKELILLHGEHAPIDEGFIYVIQNPAWPSWLKVGMTVDYEKRLMSYNVCDPTSSYKIIMLRHVENRRDSENKLLTIVRELSSEHRGEWIKIDVDLLANKFYNLP